MGSIVSVGACSARAAARPLPALFEVPQGVAPLVADPFPCALTRGSTVATIATAVATIARQLAAGLQGWGPGVCAVVGRAPQSPLVCHPRADAQTAVVVLCIRICSVRGLGWAAGLVLLCWSPRGT